MNDERPSNARPPAVDEHSARGGYPTVGTYPFRLGAWDARRAEVALQLTTQQVVILGRVLPLVAAGEGSPYPAGRVSEAFLVLHLAQEGLLHDEGDSARHRENLVHAICGIGQQLGWLEHSYSHGPGWALTLAGQRAWHEAFGRDRGSSV